MRKVFNALILLFVLSFVLVLSGCSSQNGANLNFNKGSLGVDAHFFQNLPPPQLYSGQSITIPVRVQNKGSYDTTATVYLVGFDTNILRGDTEKSVFLKGVSRTLPTGQIQDLTFKLTPTLPEDSDQFSTPISLYVCYPYETKHTFSVCVSPTISYSTSSAQCDPDKVLTFSGGQGAPVAVTSISQVPGQGLTTFDINIANVGGGVVYDSSKVGSCLDLSDMNLNKVRVVKVSMPGASVKCSPEEVYLVNGKAQFTCTANLDSKSSSGPYVTSLNIVLDYGYKKLEETKKISIIKSIRG